MKGWGGKEIDIYLVEIKSVTGKFVIGIKHFKVTTDVDNVFEEKQIPQIAGVIPPFPAASKALFDPNQVDHEESADAWSENLIIQLGECHSTLMTSPNFMHIDLKWMTIMNQFLKMLVHLQCKSNR